MGESDLIDSAVLSFDYDQSMYECYVRLPSDYRPPDSVFISNQKQLADNYPSVIGTPPFEHRFAADNPRVGLWPRHGELVNANSDMTCEDFIDSGIYYKHTTPNGSPNRDFQPLIIDLLDSTTGQLEHRLEQPKLLGLRKKCKKCFWGKNSKNIHFTPRKMPSLVLTIQVRT